MPMTLNVTFAKIRARKNLGPHDILKTDLGVLKTKIPKPPKTPKTPKLENKDPPYFLGLRNYNQLVANATES